jgi:hypothetical protein
MQIAHGHLQQDRPTVKCFFWVTPTRKLYDLFWAIHSMKADAAEAGRLLIASPILPPSDGFAARRF